MLRSLYRSLLRLHPPGFRRRFAEEMLSIFDQVQGKRGAFSLFIDGFLSLVRQWALRSDFWYDVSAPLQPSDGVPSFYTIGPYRPRTSAVVHGLVLSLAVFCLTCFAIRYSWIHVLHIHIPEVEFEVPSSIRPRAGESGMPEETSRSAWERSDAPVSSRVLSGSGDASESSPPVAMAPQNQASIGRPSPPGRAIKAPAQAVSAAMSAPNGTVRGAVEADFNSQRSSGAAGKPAQPDAAPFAVPAPVTDVKLDAAERHRVIEATGADLIRYYADRDLARKMAAALRAYEKSGDDDASTDGTVFAHMLTGQMRSVSHDQYMDIVYSAVDTPENPPAPTADDVTAYRKEMERTNCRFEKIQVLPHNIGYLKFNAFADASICGPRAAAAMAKLNDADAIIFDLRDNPGGYANMVALIATYLFDRPTHLNDFYDRGENTTEESWTLAPVPGNKLADKPAFVLTSHSTFSAAEAFSYDLKMLKRAILVGETTSGRGHMGMGHRIDEHFIVRIPGMKVVNPISKTNWEGTGVEPDVKVKAANALATAERLAERKLQRR